jgi:uncharacterized protein YjbI with pentapeptide repeats
VEDVNVNVNVAWRTWTGRWFSLSVVAGAICLLVVASAAAAGTSGHRRHHRPSVRQASLLYVINAQKGTLTPLRGAPGRFTLKLTGLDQNAVWFADRPVRRSGVFPSSGIAGAWAGFGFKTDPPNAAMDYTDPVRGPGHAAILILMHPRTRGHALLFTVRVLNPASVTSGDLEGHARRADQHPPHRVVDPALFIDDTEAPFAGGCVLEPYAQCVGATVLDADLAGLNLTGINFIGQASDDNFNGANFTDAYFIGGAQAGAPNDAGSITDSTFVDTNFTGAQMYDDYLNDLDMVGADFDRANLQNASLKGSDFAASTFRNTDFTDGTADEANFTNANLTDADLVGTWFINANFTGANLTGASLALTNFGGATFCHTTMSNGSIDNSGC